MNDRPPLTPRQSRILQTIRDSVRDRGYPPTLRELTAAVGISSSSTAAEQLRLLQAQGYIRLSPNTPRGIMVIENPGAVAAYADELDSWCMEHCRACRDPEFAVRHSHDCGITRRDVILRLRAMDL